MRITGTSIILSYLLAAQVVMGFQQRTLQYIKAPDLYLLLNANDDRDSGYRIQGSQPYLPAITRAAVACRIEGMWAFYTEEYFGGKSYALGGYNGEAKIPNFDFKDIKSIRQLSDPMSVNVDKFEAFTDTNFLGLSLGVQDNGQLENLQPLNIGSIALYLSTRHVIMCGETGSVNARNCVCLDGREAGFYLVSNLSAFSYQGGTRVRRIEQLDSNKEILCDSLPAYTP